MNKINILVILVVACVFTLGFSSRPLFRDLNPHNLISKTDTDYRNQYTGYYHSIIYRIRFQPEPIYDTIDTIMTITKFSGFTTTTCSNYLDTIHKIAITWGAYGSPNLCNSICYYIHNHIHPTISINGSMDYPEFTNCGGRFEGNFVGDSILIEYSVTYIMSGFKYQIKGKKDSVLTTLDPISSHGPDAIILFPNPFDNQLTILNSNTEEIILSIYDVSGNRRIGDLIIKQKLFNLDVRFLPKGIYLVKIQTDSKIEYKKIVKQ